MLSNKAAIVIPLYKETLTDHEKISLKQCHQILVGFPIIAIKPQKLILPDLQSLISFNDILSFDDEYFEGIAGYNKLMLSPVFYSRFLHYEYILIYQPDAFVFKNELAYWCSLDLDYIGAPWIRPIGHTDFIKALKSNFQYYFHTKFNVLKDGVPSSKQFENKIGNGGFSLRRVKIFYDLSISMSQMTHFYLEQTHIHEYNEDAFWSIEVNRKKKIMKLGTFSQGLKFAFEQHPERAYILNNKHLPFGCHAWNLYLGYWRPVFKEFGYDI